MSPDKFKPIRMLKIQSREIYAEKKFYKTNSWHKQIF